jgi:hypothetical protein
MSQPQAENQGLLKERSDLEVAWSIEIGLFIVIITGMH